MSYLPAIPLNSPEAVTKYVQEELRKQERRDAYLDALTAKLNEQHPGPDNEDARLEALRERVFRPESREVIFKAFVKAAAQKPVRFRGKLNRRWRKAQKMAARASERYYAI